MVPPADPDEIDAERTKAIRWREIRNDRNLMYPK